jgi:subtilisin family serine protease
VIHGVNVSLAIAHHAANYACGWTPVCNACSDLVDSGVVVVAAAGNTGFSDPTGNGRTDGTSYNTVSITDPGNAEKVITVGATHSTLPHRYGTSYFSARGPTADGRRKPDLLAPGEGITGPLPLVGDSEADFKAYDGTSQAAPHVSGAAALLLGRYPELRGQPERVKQILCDTATDLGREPYFQGHGLIDVLRALQSL